MTKQKPQERGRLNARYGSWWRRAAFVGPLLLMMAGCAPYGATVKAYVLGQERVLSQPLRPVMLTSGKALTERDLIISRVEWDTGEGLIQAHGPDREATLRFQTVEPNHTRLHTDIFTGKRARDIACEEALSGHIADMLAGDAIPPLEKMTAKMIPVYRSPRLSSPIVAYLAPGTVVRASTDKDGWTRVDLLSGTPGYVPSTTLRSAALTAP